MQPVTLMAYTFGVSMLLLVAALACERVFALAGLPQRWVWAAAVALSLIGPAAMELRDTSPQMPAVSVTTNNAVESPSTAATLRLRPEPNSMGPQSLVEHPATSSLWHIVWRVPEWLNVAAGALWGGASLALALLYSMGAWAIRRASRQWSRTTVHGREVLISHDIGPSVVGWLRPQIVLPSWLLRMSPAERNTALAHEREHIMAGDAQLWLAALLLLIVMPWNVPAWWQVRRLRQAMELDCDRRVLRAGGNRDAYAQLLVNLAERISRKPIMLVAILGESSQLERRIRAMMTGTPKYVPLWIAVWLAATIPLLVAAAELPVPAVPTPTAIGGVSDRAALDVVVASNAQDTPPHSGRAGALILGVKPGGVGDRAGLRVGDVVVKFGETPITDATSLVKAMQATTMGSRVTLRVRRGEDQLELTADFVGPGALRNPHPNGALPPQVAAAEGDSDAIRDARLTMTQPALRAELIRISGLAELNHRNWLISQWLTAHHPQMPIIKGDSELGTGLRKFMSGLPAVSSPGSASNVERLKQIIAQYGWPTVAMVGFQGTHAAGLIALAAKSDPAFQAEVLTLMGPLVKTGDVRASIYASLYDLVHTPQRYGMVDTCQKGRGQPGKSLEDPLQVDKRRASLGLPPISTCFSLAQVSDGLPASPAFGTLK